jgi:NDP-sugar pyrophosphorylase family protein
MKALLLSAGLGIRLRPLTDNLPKVMLNLNEKPCLLHTIENLREQKINEFAINTHYFPDKIRDFFGNGSDLGIKIKYSYEPEILGTSGALNNFRDFFSDTFAVVYADVLANFKVSPLLEVHKRYNAEGTIALDDVRDMMGKGVALTIDDKVSGFIEKPTEKVEGMVNSGFYILEPSVLDRIPSGFSDFGKDILPKIAEDGKLYHSKHKGYIFDIGSIPDLRNAENYLTNLEQR